MAYLASLAVGLLVGVLYACIRVKSPAPPLIALIGLLGMVVGEQAASAVLQARSGHRTPVAVHDEEVR